jgi:ABC-type metal ion transport system substrate-binding protein
MEARITALESIAEKTLERLTMLEVDVAVIKSNYATKEDIAKIKEDIAKSEGTLLKWFIGTAVTMTSLAFAAAKFLH